MLLIIIVSVFPHYAQSFINNYILVLFLNIILILFVFLLMFRYMKSLMYEKVLPRVKFGLWAGIVFLILRVCLLIFAIINELSIN